MSDTFRFTTGERRGMLAVGIIMAVIAAVAYIRRPAPPGESIPAAATVAVPAQAERLDSASTQAAQRHKSKKRSGTARTPRRITPRDVRDEDVTDRR